jgi:hypothetical protein
MAIRVTTAQMCADVKITVVHMHDYRTNIHTHSHVRTT